MISQRLRGIKADGEAIEEEGFMPKLQELFSSVGISIQDQNGELRSTFDILNDLAGVWDQLSSKQKQYFGEKVAGNRQVKTLNAIMQNWDVVADTIGKATNAEGEALKGNEMYMESVAGKMTQLKSAFQELTTTTISSDFVGMFVDLGTALTKIATNAGGLVPILTTVLGIFLAIKGASIAEGFHKLSQAFSATATSANALAGSLGTIGVILAAISVGIAVGKSLVKLGQDMGIFAKTYSQLQEESAKAKQAYSEEQGKLEELNSELNRTKEAIDALESKGPLTIIEEDELGRLKDTNDQLERQIRLEQIKANIKEKEARNAAISEFEALQNSYTWDTSSTKEASKARNDAMERLNKYNRGDIIDKQNEDLKDYYVNDYSYKGQVLQSSRIVGYYKQNLDQAQIALDNIFDALYKEAEKSGMSHEEDIKEKIFENEEYLQLEAIRDYYESSYDKEVAFLLDYQDKIQSTLGDFSRVESPKTERDVAFNQLLDEYEMIDQLILSLANISASDTFDLIISKYPDAIKEIKDQVDEEWEIKLSGDEAVEEINKVINELQYLYGGTAKNKSSSILSDIFMTGEGAGNVDVLNRKVLHGSDMLEKYKEEFEGFEDDIVTYFSSTYGATIADVPIQFTITPIDKDGNVYSQDEVDEYIQQLIDSSGSIEEFKANDRAGKGLLLHYTPVIDGDFESAENQEALYAQLLHSLSSFYDGDTPLQVAIDEMAQSVSFDNLVRELETKLSMPREEIESMLKEMFTVNTDQINETKYSVGELGDRLFSSADSKTTKDISEAAKSYKNLTAAMAEQQKAGVLSYETWSKLLSDKGLPGIEKYLSLTANGYTLNTDALYDFINAQNEELDLDVSAAIMERQIKIEAYQKAIEDTLDPLKDFKEIEEKQGKIDVWQSEIEQLKAVAMEAHNATGALQQFRDASKTPDQDSEHGEGQGVFETIQKRYEEGKVGTDDFKKGMGFLLGENWQEEYSNDLDKAYKEAKKIGEKYFGKEDSESADNFAKDLEKKGFATYDEATGKISMLKNESTGAAYTLEEMAEAFNMSEDAVKSLFGLLNSYSLVDQFEFDTVIGSTEQQEVAMKRLQEKTEELAAAEEELNKIEPGTPEYEKQAKEVETLKKEAEEAKSSVDTLNEAIENGGEVNPFESLDTMKAKLGQIQSTILWLNNNGITTPVELIGQAAQLQKLIDGIESNKKTNINVEATDDGATDTINTVEEKVGELNGNAGTGTAQLDANSENFDGVYTDVQDDLSTLNNGGSDATAHIDGDATGYENTSEAVKDDATTFEDTPYDVNFEATDNNTIDEVEGKAKDAEADHPIDFTATDNETIGTIESAANGVVGNSARVIQYDVGGLDKISGAKELADEVAKPRTITYGVKFEGGEVRPAGEGEKSDATYSDTTWKDKNGQVHGFSGVYQASPRQGEISPTYAKLLEQWANASETSAEASNLAAEKIEENSKTVEQDTESREKEVSYPTQPWQQEPLPNGGVAGGIEGGPALSDKVFGSKQEINTLGVKWSDEVDSMTDSLNDAVKEASEDGIEVPVSLDTEKAKEDIIEFSNDEPVFEFPVAPEGLTESVQEVENAVSEASDKAGSIIPDIGKEDIDSLIDAAGNLIYLSSGAEDATTSIEDLSEASVDLISAYSQLENVNINDTSAVESASAGFATAADNFKSAYNSLMEKVKSQQSVSITAKTQKAIDKINKLSEIKINVNVDANVNTNVPGNAKGTKSAKDGLSLVDEEGAELIEHKSQGTFELGTNNGPRFTQLESGDVVHTASETKRILSRIGSIGGYFRDGLNQAKSIIGYAFAGAGKIGGVGASKNKNKVSVTGKAIDISPIKKKSSSNKKKKKSSNSSSTSTSAFEEWAKGLFDWAEIRLERLQTVTDNWLTSAVNAIGYIAKNNQLGSAMASVNSQIEATNAAYNLYIQQANEVANQAQLSADIIQKIQNGSIEISSYDEDTQKKISQYQEWYEKALDCVDALQELHEQQKEIAGERLQNIVDDYSNIATLYQKDVNTHNAEIDYAKAIGKELYGAGEILPYGDYQKNIDAEQKVLELITGERNNLQAELDSLMASGLVVAGDENWQKYNEQLKSIDEEFWKGQKSLIDFQDAANNLKIEKIGYQLDALSNSASNMNDEMSLAAAQGSKSIDSTINQYAALRENALQQIDVLESENAVYRQLQQGLEVNSEKYQEYEKAIQDNQKAINSNKQAYEDYHTSLMQLKFDKLKYELDDVASKAEEINDAMSMQQLTGQTGFENNGLISNYQGLIQNAEDQKSELNSQIALYKEYMQAMVDVYGAEATQSTKYLDMIAKIKELEDSYRGLDESIVSWSKDIQNVKVDTISHKIEEITSKIDDYNDKISLMQASGQFVSASNYENMILLTDAEIEKLREQNQVYAEMQVGMDKYSDAYQELQSKIQSNNSAINDLMVSSIGYRDAINQIQIDKYAHQFDLLSADIEKYNDAIKEAEVVGKELTSRFYGNMIRNGEDQIQNLTNQKNAYKALMDSLVSTYGVSAKESDKYKEYEKQYLDLENQIRDTTISIEEWNKAIYDLKTEKIGWQADRTAAAIKKIEESISLFNAQGRFVDQSNYTSMINESAKQIEYLEKQNALYIEQQRGMDVYSSAYQELENKIRSNNSAINDLRVSTEGYKDAINQIKLDKYSHQLDQLSAEQEKYNDIIKDFEVSGKEIVAQYYNNLISNGNAQVKNLTNQRNAYAALMDSLVSMYGTSARESEKYKEYESQLNSLDNQIRDTTLSIKEWNNAIYDLQVEKIGWQAEQVASSIDTINRKISLYNAQGRFVNESNYDALIGENEKQIKYLEQQNNLYKQQQRGMDVYSSAYQELEGKIRSNNAAINDLRISTESYKDAIEQIQLDKYEHSLDNLTASADKYNDTIKLLETTGREITARYYNDLINNGNKQIENLEKQKAEYMSLMKTLVSTYGTTAKETEKYKEYEKQVNSLDGSIRDLTMSIVEWGKSIGQLEIDKLTWRLDELTASADRMNGAMSLHSAQGVDETAKAYKDLIQNGMRQIDILEKQNNLYEQQKANMDKNSEAYQDIQDKINSNLSTIESIKVSQEGWNDAVVDLGISDIQKYKDAISKTNDEYKRQKELQESIQELEKIATQRKVRTYVEGQGFVYQSDAEELRNAQEKLEEVVSGQLMDKLDDLIDALEESKKDTNVYDANGNLLGQVYNTPNIGALNDILSSYAEKNLPVLNVNVLKDALGKDFASSIGNTSNNNTTALNIGDIIVNEAKDGNALAQAIVDQFPNALLQALYRK